MNKTIVEAIREYVELVKIGRIWKGLCPFHTEKTPSFTIDEKKGRYHCFGCRADGDKEDFLKRIKNE